MVTRSFPMRRVIRTLLAGVTCFALAFPALAFTPNDPGFTEQWYLKSIHAPEAWDYTLGAPGVTVALLDTGVDLKHPDLIQSIWYNVGEILNGLDDDNNGFPDDVRGWNFVDTVGDPQPRYDAFVSAGIHHGTVLAGEIAARGGNSQGIAGVAWRIRLMPVRVLSSEGRGGEESVVKGIDYAVRNGADIISMSFVTTPSPLLRAAVKRAFDAGVLVVAAAGLQQNNLDRPNVGPDLDRLPGDPVCADGPNGENYIIGVGGVDSEDKLSRSSGFGKCIDILAPAEQIYSSQVVAPEHGFVNPYGGGWVGPSLAAPLVAGAAALIKSVSPGLTAPGIRDVLLNTADSVDDKNPTLVGRIGHGRLNIARALQAIGAPRLAQPEIVAARGPGTSPEVRILDASGALRTTFYAYDPSFRGGVSLASGDLDGDGHDEIVTAPGKGGGPHIRIFDSRGSLRTQFFASDQADRRGYTVAMGDLDGDGRAEIIAAPLSGEPRVRIFEWTGKLRTSFVAASRSVNGGVSLAVGDLDGDGRAEIVTLAARGAAPVARVWSRFGLLKSEFAAGPANRRSGGSVAIADQNADSRAEIYVALVGEQALRVYDAFGSSLASLPIARAGTFTGLTAGDLSRDGTGALLVSARAKSAALILLSRAGEERRWNPFGSGIQDMRAAVVTFP